MSLKMDRILQVQASGVQASRVLASRVQAPKRPESKRLVVQSPSVQSSKVQASRRPESTRPVVQSPNIQASRVQASRPCIQSPSFPVCQIKIIYLSSLGRKKNIKHMKGLLNDNTAQKMNFSIKDFASKCGFGHIY